MIYWNNYKNSYVRWFIMFQFCKGNILEGLICLLHVLSCFFCEIWWEGSYERKEPCFQHFPNYPFLFRSQLDLKAKKYPVPKTGWWFQICFIFTPIWGRFPCWLRFLKGVEPPIRKKRPGRISSDSPNFQHWYPKKCFFFSPEPPFPKPSFLPLGSNHLRVLEPALVRSEADLTPQLLFENMTGCQMCRVGHPRFHVSFWECIVTQTSSSASSISSQPSIPGSHSDEVFGRQRQ